MISEAFTVDGTAIKLVAADNIYRDVYIHITGNGTVYLGGADVTPTTVYSPKSTPPPSTSPSMSKKNCGLSVPLA